MSLQAFLCHASEDKDSVRKIYNSLKADGFRPWLDVEDLIGGQDWNSEIQKAVRSSDVVVVCLSDYSIAKTGYVQKEIRFALDSADERPEGQIYIIPLRLCPCAIPDRLRKWHAIDFFSGDGYDRLKRSLLTRTAAEVVRDAVSKPIDDQQDSPSQASLDNKLLGVVGALTALNLTANPNDGLVIQIENIEGSRPPIFFKQSQGESETAFTQRVNLALRKMNLEVYFIGDIEGNPLWVCGPLPDYS